jgi:DNA ligase-1
VRRFTALVSALDSTTRTTEKVDALAAYFEAAPPEDAAWALYLLTGRRVKRIVPASRLRGWMVERTGHPDWLVEEAYSAVGDLAETLALLHPGTHADDGDGTDLPLHRMIEEHVLPLREMDEPEARRAVLGTWAELTAAQRFVWNKLLTGAFRLGVGRKLTVRGLARSTGLPASVLAHRTTGPWDPTAVDFARIVSADSDIVDPGRPYPFFLAHPVDPETGPEPLGAVADWQAEWKWDGIRAQLILRRAEALLWSRGEELVTPQFPEIEQAARALPDGTVLDGEIVAWGPDGIRPFAELQRRLNRKRVSARLLEERPTRFIAYDLLEQGGEDLRTLPLSERRSRLEEIVAGADVPRGHHGHALLTVSPLVDAPDWAALARLRSESRERGVEGLMLKRREGPYRAGRPRGDWWKWKVEPLRIDAVLLYAQRGHGRRASLHSDYTFGVWHDGTLVPVAKAYSGLTDAEIREVDRWVRRNTIERFGPVRSVEPQLVFEIAFDGLRASTRHRSGVALRFPRMARWRKDKPAAEADRLASVLALIPESERPA